MIRLVSSIIRHTVLANVLLLFIILAGIVSAFSMVREGLPQVSTDTIMITVVYPGADPYEVEEGVSRKLEEAIDGLEGIKRYTTVSLEGIARAVVTIEEGFSMDLAKELVRNAVDSISTFPVESEKPTISEQLIRAEVLHLALWGDMDERTRKEFGETIKDELQALPGISQVTMGAFRPYEISIELSEQRLREYGLTFRDISDAIGHGNIYQSGGSLRTKGEKIQIRTVGRKYTGQEMAKIVVLSRPTGELVTLDQIATIRDGFTEDAVLGRFNGKPCVMITVFKTTDEDAIDISDKVNAFVDKKAPFLPAGVNLTAWGDRSEEVRGQLDILMKNGLIGLAIVLLSLWMFLELRLSFWVAMGIPISLSGGLVVMWMMGSTFNILSLLGLILVMGIIVDDAIVVGEAIYVRRKMGDSSLLAATNGVLEVGLPVIAAVTTTIVAFLPLAFIGGIMGKFVQIVPKVVIAALAVSIIEALFLLPAHLTHLSDPKIIDDPAHPWRRRAMTLRRAPARALERFVERVYSPFIILALEYRYVAMATALSMLIVTVGLFRGGLVEFVTFPQQDTIDLIASIEFPVGTPIEVTEAAVEQTERALWEIAREAEAAGDALYIRNVYTLIGESDAALRGADNGLAGAHKGLVRVQLIGSEERSTHSKVIVGRWQGRVGKISGALSQSFSALALGPPGAPIEVWLRGDDTAELRAASKDLRAKLSSYEGVYQVEDDYRPGSREMQIDIKPEANMLGLTLEDLASQVYSGFYGEEAIRLQRGRDDVRVKVRYSDEERSTMADLERVRIRTSDGYEVPFFSVADVRFEEGVASITRSNGKRMIAVTAEVEEAVANTEKVLADLQSTFMDDLIADHPGVLWSYEGAKKDGADAFKGVAIGFPAAMVGIFVIIATVFRSYAQPFVILITVPFGIIGATLGHMLMGLSLTMFSVFGMVALTGVVVNDAIVLIEAVNSRIAKGDNFFDAIRAGATRRFRAILLTTISTVGGLTPLILEKAVEAQMLIPMALSLAAGVAFSTVFTLVLIPCLLGVLSDLRLASHYLIYGSRISREEAEPARTRFIDPLEEPLRPPVDEAVTAIIPNEPVVTK